MGSWVVLGQGPVLWLIRPGTSEVRDVVVLLQHCQGGGIKWERGTTTTTSTATSSKTPKVAPLPGLPRVVQGQGGGVPGTSGAGGGVPARSVVGQRTGVSVMGAVVRSTPVMFWHGTSQFNKEEGGGKDNAT